MRNPVRPSSCVTPAGTSSELDVQNEWEESTHNTHSSSSSAGQERRPEEHKRINTAPKLEIKTKIDERKTKNTQKGRRKVQQDAETYFSCSTTVVASGLFIAAIICCGGSKSLVADQTETSKA